MNIEFYPKFKPFTSADGKHDSKPVFPVQTFSCSDCKYDSVPFNNSVASSDGGFDSKPFTSEDCKYKKYEKYWHLIVIVLSTSNMISTLD